MSNIIPFERKGKKPPKPPRRPRQERLWVRLSDQEAKDLRALAQLSKLAPQDFLRVICLFAIEERWHMQPGNDSDTVALDQ